MRFPIRNKAHKQSEAGELPSEQLLTEMGRVRRSAGEGPSAKGSRVKFIGTKTFDGPFTETRERVAGFWLWSVKSKEEAIASVEKCPAGDEAEIELRQIFEAEGFGAALTPELRAREDRLRAQLK